MKIEKKQKLLEESENSSQENKEDHIDDMFSPQAEPPTTYKMFTCFIKLAIPAIFTNLAAFATVVTNGVFAGRLNDPSKLAVVVLTSVCCNIMIQSLL